MIKYASSSDAHCVRCSGSRLGRSHATGVSWASTSGDVHLLLLGEARLVGVQRDTFAWLLVVDLGELDIFVVGHELLHHHGTTTDFDDEVITHIFDAYLLRTIDVVTLADAFPWNWASESYLVNILSEHFVNQIALDWNVKFVLRLFGLWFPVKESSKLIL